MGSSMGGHGYIAVSVVIQLWARLYNCGHGCTAVGMEV
jgi:hypothetical protein